MAVRDDLALQKIPQVSLKRSSFNLSFNHKMTFSPNALFPCFTFRCVPGDTIEMSTNMFVRFNNLLVPVMDNLKVDVYFFFMRDRDIYDVSKRVVGERKSKNDTNEYRFPYIVNTTFPYIAVAVDSDPNHRVYKDLSGNDLPGDASGQSDPANIRNVTGLTLTQNGVGYEVPFAVDGISMTTVSPTRYNAPFANAAAFNSLQFAHSVMPNVKVGSLLDYLGCPVGSAPMVLNAMKPMMYYNIFDKMFRPEQLCDGFVAEDHQVDIVAPGQYICDHWSYNQKVLTQFLFPCHNYYDSENKVLYGSFRSLYWSYYYDNVNYGSSYDFARDFAFSHGGICPVMSKTDYFVLSTLSPQEGEAVGVYTDSNVPFNFSSDGVPVVGNGKGLMLTNGTTLSTLSSYNAGAGSEIGLYADAYNSSVVNVGTPITGTFASGYNNKALNVTDDPTKSGLKTSSISGSASLSAGTRLTSVELLRQAFQLQRYFERSNRAGFRFQEIIKGHYGTTILDDKLGQPQLLSIASGSFNIIPVVQTAGTQEGGTPQGYLTANGVASIRGGHFILSTPEHGYIMGLVCARGINTYQEQYTKDNFEFDQFDLFWPEFVGLGDQAVLNYEVFNPMVVPGSSVHSLANSGVSKHGDDFHNIIYNTSGLLHSVYANSTDFVKISNRLNQYAFEPFGFQERYAEYRYRNNSLSGLFRSRASHVASIIPNYRFFGEASSRGNISIGDYSPYAVVSNVPSLDVWHYAQNFDDEKYFTLPSMNVDGLSAGLSIFSGVPVLSSQFVTSSVPWERSAFYTDIQPLYSDIYYSIRATRPLPVLAVPGLADHY